MKQVSRNFKAQILQNILSGHDRFEVEINNDIMTGKPQNTWKLKTGL